MGAGAKEPPAVYRLDPERKKAPGGLRPERPLGVPPSRNQLGGGDIFGSAGVGGGVAKKKTGKQAWPKEPVEPEKPGY